MPDPISHVYNCRFTERVTEQSPQWQIEEDIPNDPIRKKI